MYLQLFVTEHNDDNNHSQTQDYCPHDVHDIIMQPNNQNTDQQDYQNHALSGIGIFTQCWLCDIYFLSQFCKNMFTLQLLIFQVMLL